MKVLAINGSPRKTGNTATLLSKALEGAALEGAETELVHLSDIDFKGCRGCNTCKRIDGKSHGKCAYQDGLTPVLKKAEDADALTLGSPVYLMSATGEMRCFLERLVYPRLMSGFRNIPAGFIYTMGATEAQAQGSQNLRLLETQMKWAALEVMESLFVHNALQFDDLSKYFSRESLKSDFKYFEEKAKIHEETFPIDCEKAFEMGARLAKAAGEGV